MSDDAAQALAVVTATRATLADRVRTLGWYHPVIGLAEGAVVASWAAPLPVRLAVVALTLLVLGAAVSGYRARTGTWTSSWRLRRLRGVPAALRTTP